MTNWLSTKNNCNSASKVNFTININGTITRLAILHVVTSKAFIIPTQNKKVCVFLELYANSHARHAKNQTTKVMLAKNQDMHLMLVEKFKPPFDTHRS